MYACLRALESTASTKLIVSRISKHKSEERFIYIISKVGKKRWANITPTETTCIANEKLLRNIMMRTQTPFKHRLPDDSNHGATLMVAFWDLLLKLLLREHI